MSDIIPKDAIIHASGFVLTTILPSDYDKWNKVELDQFLEYHACEDYEGWHGDAIMEHIQSAAWLCYTYYLKVKYDE